MRILTNVIIAASTALNPGHSVDVYERGLNLKPTEVTSEGNNEIDDTTFIWKKVDEVSEEVRKKVATEGGYGGLSKEEKTKILKENVKQMKVALSLLKEVKELYKNFLINLNIEKKGIENRENKNYIVEGKKISKQEVLDIYDKYINNYQKRIETLQEDEGTIGERLKRETEDLKVIVEGLERVNANGEIITVQAEPLYGEGEGLTDVESIYEIIEKLKKELESLKK